jgi:hypothetical protein
MIVSVLRSILGSSRDELWEQMAKDIGGEYKDGGSFGQNVVRYSAGEWEITLDTYATGDGNSSVDYTRMRAPFVNKDGLRFNISREGLFAHLEKLFGMQDIQIGDEYFDKNFLIKGSDEEKIKLLLKSPKLKKLIQGQPDINFQIRNDDGWFGESFPDGVDELYFECYGILHEEKRLKALFDMFSTTLERLVLIDSAYENDPNVEL